MLPVFSKTAWHAEKVEQMVVVLLIMEEVCGNPTFTPDRFLCRFSWLKEVTVHFFCKENKVAVSCVAKEWSSSEKGHPPSFMFLSHI